MLDVRPTKLIEIHENQRCWIGRGFSARGLLPNDRGPYSLLDGSQSWKTLEEAGSELRCIGWNYQDESKVFSLQIDGDERNSNEAEGDEDGGWRYARDFSAHAVKEAKKSRGPLHWVRFRKWTRRIVFDPDQFCKREVYSKCGQCESKAVKTLSAKLLQVLAYTTLVHHGTLKESVLLRLKTNLLVELIHHPSTDQDAFYQLDILNRELQKFADNEKQVNIGLRSVFSNLPPFANSSEIPGFAERCKAVSARQFSEAERNAIALIMVKKLDPHFQLHCDKEDCGDDCHFQWVPCVNSGCTEVMSRLYLSEHDDECGYKLVPCACGDTIPRSKQSQHLSEVCPLRQGKCPFAHLGCSAIVLAKDIPQHVENDTGAHLLLALHRMMQYESTIRNINQKVNKLERENGELKAMLLAEKGASTKSLKAVDQKVNALQKKVKGDENSNHKEFKRMRDQLRGLEKSHVK